MTDGAGQSSNQVTWCASYLLNAFGDPGGMWGPCSSTHEHAHSYFLWKLLWVYLCGIFQADRTLLGLRNEPPWGFHKLSWERSVVIFGTAAWAVLSTDHTLVTGCLCPGQLGEPAGWAGSCSRHMQSWLWPADQMACRHSHYANLRCWEKLKKKKKKGAQRFKEALECMWHCCEKAQEVNAWFHRLSNGLLRCT